MSRRYELQSLLENLIGEEHKENVYFQPPSNIRMNYPAIVYGRDNYDATHADNIPYLNTVRYQVTVIDQNPDSQIVSDVAQLKLCSYSRQFQKDNLNHDIFSLYY